jgi:hypothetical protein
MVAVFGAIVQHEKVSAFDGRFQSDELVEGQFGYIHDGDFFNCQLMDGFFK